VIIFVRPEDTSKFTKLNGFTFASAQLRLEVQGSTSGASKTTLELKEKLQNMLARRYNAESKVLDLSAIGQDPEFVNTGMFETGGRDSKFFLALMTVCDETFASAQQKRDSVSSISLAHNSLPNVASVSPLATTFPDIKDLDLSHNKFEKIEALSAWRKKFRNLDQLIISDNPFTISEQGWHEDLAKWYPTLRVLNGVQVRSNEEVVAAAVANKRTPFPILPPSFKDQSGIGEKFLRTYFSAYDADRRTLASAYYDADSTFTLSVNTRSPTSQTKVPSWDRYIKFSRNLMKTSTLPARMNRLFKGAKKIGDLWMDLPSSRHPDLVSEGAKWCIEGHPLPGLPDPSGRSPTGVLGLIIVVHGEFGEVDVSTNQVTAVRSFDRTFVLGPGGGVDGVRVVNDTLCLRAYAGAEAWKPQQDLEPNMATATRTPVSQQVNGSGLPDLPVAYGVLTAGKTEEQVKKEYLEIEFCKATRLTLQYSKMCLETIQYDPQQAMGRFEEVKVSMDLLYGSMHGSL